MAFTLKEVRTGQQHTFSAKEILELIGDRINDEIIIRDDIITKFRHDKRCDPPKNIFI